MSVAEESTVKEFREGASNANRADSDETAENGNGAFVEEIENYLSGLSQKKKEFVDPKLKKETQKLVDLLKSYKNLSEELDRKCAEAAREGIQVPTREILNRRAEIYALLHPELYKNKRDEEKNKLIEKLSTRRHFNEVDKVICPDLTPVSQVADKRQIEKERFCRLVASAPTRFHNCLDQTPVRFKRLTRPPATPPFVFDVRESEKERLAHIFATSVTFSKRANARKNILRNSPKKSSPSTSPTRFQDSNCEANQLHNNRTKFNGNRYSEPTTDVDAMVRIGEYSPLNKYSNPSIGRTVSGLSEHEEKKKILSEEPYNEYRHLLDKARREKVDEAVMVSPSEVPRFLNTTSTQTEYNACLHEEPIMTVQSQKFVEISPREKLLFDLYGDRSAGILEQEEKRKQTAYALALKQQIEEKKRFEEGRKRREKEEEEMIERRCREQLERIQKEHDYKPYEKEDPIAKQRESQDEHLIKRLAQLALEEEELLKREKLGRLKNESKDTLLGRVYTNKRSISAANTGLQVDTNRGKTIESRAVSVPASAAILPERLPEPDWTAEDWSQMQLKGVDLLREHRTQKDRLQLPPLVDNTSKVKRSASKSPKLRSPVSNYVPSTVEEAISRSKNSHQVAEAILKAPLDEPIVCKQQLPKSATAPHIPQRSTSPVIPAVRTERIMKRNSRILNEKWKVPDSANNELERTGIDRNNVLTQLGAFRRQLAMERQKLEERMQEIVPS